MNYLSSSKCVPENYFWCSLKIEQKSPESQYFDSVLTGVSADCFHLEAQNSEPLQNLLQLMTTWKIVPLSASSWCLSSSILWLQSHFKTDPYKKELQIGNIDFFFSNMKSYRSPKCFVCISERHGFVALNTLAFWANPTEHGYIMR